MKFVPISSTCPLRARRRRAGQRRYGLERVVKLASNEFPLPPVAGVKEAIVATLDDLNRYPDAYCDRPA